MLPKQTRYGASAITGRADYSWPDGKRLAFWIAINIETFGFRSGVGPDPVMIGSPVDRPLVCCVSLHTYIAGQPFRLAPLRKALQHIIGHKDRDRVWYTHSDAIAEYCQGLEKGLIPGS